MLTVVMSRFLAQSLLAVGADPVAQFGPVIGGAIILSGVFFSATKYLVGRLEKSHDEQVASFKDALTRSELRADKAESRADRYERELVETTRAWFSEVRPVLEVNAHAIASITEDIRRTDRGGWSGDSRPARGQGG